MTLSLTRSSTLQLEIEQITGTNLDACLECGCCSGGCSGIEFMDYGPRQIIQLIKLGRRQQLLSCRAIWMCMACHICEDRCPAAIDIAKVMDAIREMAANSPVAPDNNQKKFHRQFLGNIKRFGRLHEGYFALSYNLSTHQPLPDSKLMIKLLAKGRVELKPPRLFPGKAYRRMIRNMIAEGSEPHA